MMILTTTFQTNKQRCSLPCILITPAPCSGDSGIYLSLTTFTSYIHIYVTIYNIHVSKFLPNGSHSTYHFTKWFISLLCFWDLSIFIYAFSLLCSILFIYSFSCWWICRWFPVFPIISNVILDSFFYACHRTLLMFNLLVAGRLSSGIWQRVHLRLLIVISPGVSAGLKDMHI